MLKTSFFALLLASATLNGLYAEEQQEAYECKKCSLRPRPNTQPNQHEFYEDYLKTLEQKDQKISSEASESK